MKYQKGFVLPLVIIIVLLVAGGGFYLYNKNSQTANNQIENKVLVESPSESPSASTTENSSYTGFVNRKEISSQDISIFAGIFAEIDSIDNDGNFKIDTSKKLGVQYIAVQDKEYNPLASFLYVPNYTTNILIDTKSTARANIFIMPGIATTDPVEAKIRLNLIETSNCLPKFEAFLFGKLQNQNLLELSQDKKYQEILGQCQTELFSKF